MATMNYDRFLSLRAKERQPQAIRQSYEKMLRSGLDPSQIINMSGGMPNPSVSPFVSAEFKLSDGSTLTIDEKKMVTAMQYGPSSGDPSFSKKVRDFIQTYHNPPTANVSREEGGLDCCILAGAQSGVEMCFDLMLNPGDNFIVEEPTFAGALGAALPSRGNPLPVPVDGQGMIPAELRKLLERWSPEAAKDPQSDIPKCMYVIPTGTNPSGMTLTDQRRREIYQVAREYDLMIIEDDPYYFIHFADKRPTSFLALDVDGRVIRLDSFSKIIAAGLRVGVVSGPAPLVQRIMWNVQVTVGHCSSFSQVLIDQLFDKWGKEGIEKQLDRCRNFYLTQRNLVNKCATKHLTGLAEWLEPSAGMFLWVKINGIEDSVKFIEGPLIKQMVLVAPGFCFMLNSEKPSPYLRISFSNLSEEKMDKGFKCLAAAIKEELANKQNGGN